MQRQQKSSITCYGQNKLESQLYKMLFNIFHPKESRACSPLPTGHRVAISRWPQLRAGHAHGSGRSQKGKVLSQLLTLQLLKSTGCCDPPVFRPSRLSRFFPLSSWPENCQTDFPDTPLLTPARAMAILCLRSWISSQNNL